MSDRRIFSDLDGRATEVIADDEIGLVLCDATRVALIKFLEQQSLNDMRAKKLSDDEARLLFALRHRLD